MNRAAQWAAKRPQATRPLRASRRKITIGPRRYRLFGALIGVAAAACGKWASEVTEPMGSDAGSVDAAAPGSDASPKAPLDASDTDAWSNAMDAGMDGGTAASGADDARAPEAGDANSGDADAADADDAADGEDGNVPISCTETSTCAAPISLGSIWGGVISGSNETAGTSGASSGWYQVEIQPYPPPAVSNAQVNVTVSIEPPAGMEFDLAVYFTAPADYPSACATPTGTSVGDAGALQAVKLSFPNTDVGGISGWLTIHVSAKPGSQCFTGETFSLEVDTAL
jgi:hypothetical protein